MTIVIADNDRTYVVEHIIRSLKIAVLSDGTQVPVELWFDDEGENCEPDEAESCVCGNDDIGWFAVDLTPYSSQMVH